MDYWTNDLEAFMTKLINDFYDTFNYEPFKFSTSFTANLWESYISARPDHKSKFKQQDLSNCHGTIVPPQHISGNFMVLIDINYMLEDIKIGHFSWVGTIIHEITHARDYIEYAELIGAKSYDEVIDFSKANNALFNIWTEFSARRHGYYFVRKYSFDNMTDVSQVPDILQREMPFHINQMIKDYNSSKDAMKQLYAIAQFSGRLSIWRMLFPQHFTHTQIKELFVNNDWIYDMFIFLDCHHNLSDAYSNFDNFRTILSRNFKGF